MGGGLMQLVAYGAQDVYLTGNPQVTFFKTVHRRHTNFAMETISNNFSGSVEFGRRATCTISRNGDLVHKMYLMVTLPNLKNGSKSLLASDDESGSLHGWCKKTGLALIKTVDVEIGGQRIDKHYSEWLDVWSQLSMPAEKADGFACMINKCETEAAAKVTDSEEKLVLYIPLQFWFCTNPGLSLPLIALQYHEVKINFEFRELKQMVCVPVTKTANEAWVVDNANGASKKADELESSDLPSGDLNAELLVDYIYLDTEERRRFAQISHEYLITQLQHTGAENFANQNVRYRLNLNHPVKELVWVVVEDEAADSWNEHFCYDDMKTQAPLIDDVKLQLNGHDRFASRKAHYFNLVQPWQHHTAVPTESIMVYSFALKPEDIQPSGTCNFSRIDNATLIVNSSTEFQSYQALNNQKAAKFRLFATNYNVLRIMSGMGGLAYAN